MRRPLSMMKSEVDRLKGLVADTTSAADSTAPSHEENLALLKEKENLYQDSLSLVLDKLTQCTGFMPDDWRPRVLRHEIFMSHDMSEEAEKTMKEALKIDPENKEYLKYYAQALDKNGKKKESNEILKKLLNNDSDPWFAHASLAKNYEELKMYDSAIMVMEQFTASHPGDRRAASYIQQLKAVKDSRKKPSRHSVSDTSPVPEADTQTAGTAMPPDKPEVLKEGVKKEAVTTE